MKKGFLMFFYGTFAVAAAPALEKVHCVWDYQAKDLGFREFYVERENGRDTYELRTRILKGTPWSGKSKFVEKSVAKGLECEREAADNNNVTCDKGKDFDFRLRAVVDIDPLTDARQEYLEASWSDQGKPWKFESKPVKGTYRGYCELK